jgi:hypothetical protein
MGHDKANEIMIALLLLEDYAAYKSEEQRVYEEEIFQRL